MASSALSDCKQLNIVNSTLEAWFMRFGQLTASEKVLELPKLTTDSSID